MDNLVYWIWLSLACTPDSTTFSKLISKYDDAKDIYNLTDREIRSVVGAKVSDCSALADKGLDKATQIYKFCTEKGVGILTYQNENFPVSLRDIPTPPVLLYYRGKLPDFNTGFRCAIVGTRSLSDYGRKNAFKLGYDMGCVGATVVSGMAIGIDGVAMAGAIAAGASTVAVIGSGIDVCYPSVHLTLARNIVKNGCVLTEYAPGTKPEKFNFPRRNRIISGLCPATVIVEGKESSGSMITARHAKAQGREVFAFPGNVGADGSQSTNLLIKNGAHLCTGAEDIIGRFEKEYPGVLNPFLLKETPGANMLEVLRELRVSALTPNDDVFFVPKSKKEKRAESMRKTQKIQEKKEEKEENLLPEMPAFDAESLKLYKKIPPNEECTIESLTDDEMNLRLVMKLLLKLEMGRFVTMLPGDRVKRNIR